MMMTTQNEVGEWGRAHLAYRTCERCGQNAKPASGEKRLYGGEKGNVGWQVLRAWDEMEKDDIKKK